MEIAPGVHRIRCEFDSNRMVFVHLLVGDNRSMLVDTGCAHNPEQDIIPYLESIGLSPSTLDTIVVSHSDLDHQGGNAPMKAAAPGAILACHRLDYNWVNDTDALIEGRYAQFDADHGIVMPAAAKDAIRAQTLSAPVELTLQGGERFWLSDDWAVEVVHAPGHTWGHLAVYDSRSKTLISGEAAMGTAIPDVDWNPILPPTYCYVDTYLSSIDRLLGMEIDTLSPAHWPVQQGPDVASFLTESRNYCLHVEQILVDFAGDNPGYTLAGAIKALGATLGRWPASGSGLLTYPMMGNIDRLVQRNQLVASKNADGVTCWRLP
jgi:glyoxylase-like metal-dependent hydrolase (beta-lactamase superfamily II)